MPKTIIITGATKGIGKAIAMQFAQNGYNLLLCSRNQADLASTASEIEKLYNVKVNFYAADVSIKQECIAFANWCKTTAPHIDVLVNNAGFFIPGNINDEPDGILEQMINTNLYSAYYVTRGIVSLMIEQQQGHIFNICSIASLKAYTNGGSYSISKYALLGFSQNLREELKDKNIKVTTVLPGAVYTNSWSGSGINPQRIMESSDVAAMVFATSQLSPQAVVEDIILRPQLGDL
jgi:short-subunit dehydrogenase